MAKQDFDMFCNSRSAGVDFSIRESLLGWNSPLWKEMQAQSASDAITDICFLFPFHIWRDDKQYERPILTQPGNGVVLTPLGELVADKIVNTELVNSKIIQYSINTNSVGKEVANNRLSLAVYAHFDNPDTEIETRLKTIDEINMLLIDPIRNILKSNNTIIGMSSYNFGDVIANREQLEELLLFVEGYRFTKGHF